MTSEPRAGRRAARWPGERGYTMLEMLVALAILGVALTLVSVQGINMLNRVRERAALGNALGEVRNLRITAIAERRSIIIAPESQAAAPEQLSEGWSVASRSGAAFLPSGVCLGEDLRLISPRGQAHELALESPSCEIRGAEL